MAEYGAVECSDRTYSRPTVLRFDGSVLRGLLPEGETCSTCRAHIGIAKRFRAFLHRFVPTDHQSVLTVYESLYSSRSLVAHGSWHDIVDNQMFGLTVRDPFVERLAAWAAAKIGAIGWLNGGGNSVPWWNGCDNGHKE